MSQEGATPGGNAVTQAAADDLRRQPPRRPTPGVDQPGLTGERLAVLDHPNDVTGSAADSRARDDDQVARVTEDLTDFCAQPTGSRTRIELRLDEDPATVNVQTAGESQNRRHLGLPAAGLGDLDGGQLRFHLGGHCHWEMMTCIRLRRCVRCP